MPVGVNGRINGITASTDTEAGIGNVELAPWRGGIVALSHIDFGVASLAHIWACPDAGVPRVWVGGLAIGAQKSRRRPSVRSRIRELSADFYRPISKVEVGPLNITGDVRP